MSEPTYTITISESERTALAKALGTLTTKLLNAPIFVEAPNGGTQAARSVLAPSHPPSPPAAAHTPAPVELRDRWARDRKGNELPFPEGVVTREVTIWKTEQKTTKAKGNGSGKPFLKVTWQSQERGYVDANCFDEKLCPWIITRMGQKTTLYLVKSGEYLNIVGVRA